MAGTGESALVVVLPEAEPVVGVWRRRYDSSAALGVPAHVTVVYPFLDLRLIGDATRESLRELFSAHRPFDLRFDRCGHFSEVLYLAPDPPGPFQLLTEAVVARWPEAPPYGGRFTEIVPHLTVAEGVDDPTLGAAERGVAGGLPLAAHAGAVTLLVKDGPRWREDDVFPLGR
ncbi:2'-5' RNA ligase family protein [Sphaerisporangium sp. NPDC088356]|uniref:2'-5' RNA ligase family protein n=1 Tax=Sphaerisporangium sp. NPDC088356 TaxID=3154871 RepID=UPI003434DB72